MKDLDVIKEALLYAATVTHSMPPKGLKRRNGEYVKPNLDLVWAAEAARRRLSEAAADRCPKCGSFDAPLWVHNPASEGWTGSHRPCESDWHAASETSPAPASPSSTDG